MDSQARACGVDLDEDRDYEQYPHHYQCSTCDAYEDFAQYRANFVCPWCGEGVMQFEE